MNVRPSSTDRSDVLRHEAIEHALRYERAKREARALQAQAVADGLTMLGRMVVQGAHCAAGAVRRAIRPRRAATACHAIDA